MIRYNDNRQVSPPAPFVHVGIRHPQLDEGFEDCPAQLDCAADFTVVPATVIEQLHLAQLDHVLIGGFGGHVTLAPTFLVRLAIRGLAPLLTRVVSSEGEPYVLLGRDVLNQYRTLLDDPRQILEMNRHTQRS